jgi:hypothetical protein
LPASESFGLIPLRWPAEWGDPSVLDSIRGTPINTLFADSDTLPDSVAERAQALGLRVLDDNHLPADVKIVDGEWPGVRLSRTSSEAVDAGPTGAPWIDSNTWRVQLERTLAPNQRVWIRSKTPNRVILAAEIPVAVADAAIAGGQWIITLPADFQSWGQLDETLRFFAAHPDWPAMETRAVLGVLSSFTGPDKAMASEVLNLTARMKQPYRILLPGQQFPDLRAVIYADSKPGPELRTALLSYVSRGGLLVANDTWDLDEGTAVNPDPNSQLQTHPRFTLHQLGLGRLAIPKKTVVDPYQFAADAQVLMSHRWDPVSFWNAGAYGSHLTSGPHGGALLHLVNYTASASANHVTVRVRGEYKQAVLFRPDHAQENLSIQAVGHAAEVYLPDFPSCASLELS